MTTNLLLSGSVSKTLYAAVKGHTKDDLARRIKLLYLKFDKFIFDSAIWISDGGTIFKVGNQNYDQFFFHMQ